MVKKFTWHRNPAERTPFEKFARKFFFPEYPYTTKLRGWDPDVWQRQDERRKKSFPIRWFLSETIPGAWSTVTHKWDGVRDWVRWRSYDRYHVVKTDLRPGYYDKDEILLQVSFKLLKDYVEIELANMMNDEDEEKQKWRRFKTRCRRFFRVHSHERNPALGVAYLKEEISDPHIKGTIQGRACEEKLELYHWWTVIRPSREDTFTTPLIWKDPEDCMSLTRNNTDEYRTMHKLDDFYANEDQEMLIRLMTIRNHLWS